MHCFCQLCFAVAGKCMVCSLCGIAPNSISASLIRGLRGEWLIQLGPFQPFDVQQQVSHIMHSGYYTCHVSEVIFA